MAASKTRQAGRRGAAFFDLDRTLLAGASGEAFATAMRATGVVTRSIPGESVLYGLFNRVGETLPTMALARQAVRLAKGRDQATVRQAARMAADELVGLVQPLAAALFDEHRAAGRPVVLATTTPFDMVEPLAGLLGLDGVVATRYGVAADGTYDGTLDGPFVWAAGKLEAVRRWADEHDVDLAESYAYSDSVYDTPLLAAVGHPVVVNPDPRMVVMAAARRWPTISLAQPKQGRNGDGGGGLMGLPGLPALPGLPGLRSLQRVALELANPLLVPYANVDITGVEHIPSEGPAIIVANHRSYFDPLCVAMVMARAGRTARFLGKKEVFDVPVVGRLAEALGGIRVDRGTGSDAPLLAAAAAIDDGNIIALMPQGTIPRGRAFFDVELKGRWGAARLAALTKVPVIPIGLWGTEQVWPRSARVPNVLNVLTPPKVRVHVGPPVALKYRSPDADTKRIMQAIMDLLPPESRVPHEPTEQELLLTLPHGYRGEVDGEHDRRPGRDR